MKISPNQKAILNEAIELLRPYDKEQVSYWTVYFEDQDKYGDCKEQMDPEYDTCDTDACEDAQLALLKERFPDKNIQKRYWYNDGDHEDIESCSICGRPLNSQLTWVREEFEHYNEEIILPEDIINYSRAAFDLIQIFDNMPSIDERPSPYALNNYPDKAYRKEGLFAFRVVGLAKRVITLLKQPAPEGQQ